AGGHEDHIALFACGTHELDRRADARSVGPGRSRANACCGGRAGPARVCVAAESVVGRNNLSTDPRGGPRSRRPYTRRLGADLHDRRLEEHGGRRHRVVDAGRIAWMAHRSVAVTVAGTAGAPWRAGRHGRRGASAGARWTSTPERDARDGWRE